MTTKLKKLIIVSRPISWPTGVLFYFAGVGGFENFNLLVLLEIIIIPFVLGTLIFGLNDIYDIKSDAINDRKGGLQGAKIKAEDVVWLKKVMKILIPIPILVALFSLNPVHIILSIVGVALAVGYSVPPIRFKERPFLDSFVNMLGAMIVFLLGYSVHSNIFELSLIHIILFFPMLSLHALTALEDINEDRSAGFTTIATKLGITGTILFTSIVLLPLLLYPNLLIQISGFIAASLSFVGILIDKKKNDKYLFGLSMVITALVMLNVIYNIIENFF